MSILVPIEFKNQRIMTTKVLAEQYGTEETNIKTNFNNNKDRFEEGKHYYQLIGEELKEFKRVVNDINDPSIKFASILTLWTDRGAARHAKILDTDEAWEVYEKLEDNYFRIKSEDPALNRLKEFNQVLKAINPIFKSLNKEEQRAVSLKLLSEMGIELPKYQVLGPQIDEGINRFINECCLFGSSYVVGSNQLYYAYIDFCRRHNIFKLSKTGFRKEIRQSFKGRIKEKLITNKRISGFKGIRLNNNYVY